jgi:aminoglycoside phosphotransferase (APT) family kinase protein
MQTADLGNHLEDYYLRILGYPQGTRIENISHIEEGWESDIFTFEVDSSGGRERLQESLILRIYPGDDAYEKSAREFQNLQLLDGLGFPVPKVFTLERDASPFNRPFVIMERVPGEVLWAVMFSDASENINQFIDPFCSLFVKLHHLDWRPFLNNQSSVMDIDPIGIIKSQLESWRVYYDRFPLPDFLPVFEWLEVHLLKLQNSRLSALHWDYHPGNVILRPDDSLIVIDWTGLQVSDPRFDLAWTLMLITAYEGYQWRKPILDSYELHAGEQIDGIEFFDVAACLRRLFSIAVSISAGAEQMGMRPGAEKIMENQQEPIQAVYDLHLERSGIRIPLVEDWLA